LAQEAIDLIETAAEDFRRVFERNPHKKGEPLFLLKYLVSEEEQERQTVEILEHSNAPPHIIYAYRKTGGLLVTSENERLIPTKDLEDWNSAIDEYFRLQENPPETHPVDVLFHSLEDELDSCLICLGYVLEHGRNPRAQRIASSSEYFTVDDYVLVCVTKSMKTLRSIKALLEAHIGADGLSLARHLLENYFHIVFAIARPDMLKHLVDAPIGLKRGTHDFERTANGRINSRKILRKEDGAEYLGHVTRHEMAKSSPYKEDLELFDYLYSFLSEFTHPSTTGFELVFGEHGELNALSNELRSEALFYSIRFAALILDELRKIPILSTKAKKDIKTVAKRIGTKARLLIAALFEEAEPPQSFALLRDRLSSLGT